MSRTNDRNYHASRAEDELKRAAEAADPAVAALHRELAVLHKRRMMALVEPSERKLPGIAIETGPTQGASSLG